MSATANAFGQTILDTVAFGIETQTYTYGPITLPTGQSQIFLVQNWNEENDIERVVILEEIAAGPSDANVSIYWKADTVQSNQAQGYLDAMPQNYLPFKIGAVAGKDMALYVQNNRGSTLANFQLNYTVTVMKFSLFQRLLWGFPETPDDVDAITKYAAELSQNGKNVTPQAAYNSLQSTLKAGGRPFSFDVTYDAVFDGREKNIPQNAMPLHLKVPSSASKSTPINIRVPSDYVSIIRGIWLNSSNTDMTLMVDRDKNTGLINELNPPAFVQGSDNLPLRFFIPFTDHINVYCNGTSGTTYPVRLHIDQYQKSDLLMGHLWLKKFVTQKIQLGFN